MFIRLFNAYVDGLILVYFSDVKFRRWVQREYQKRAKNKGWNKITLFAMCMLLTSHICIQT